MAYKKGKKESFDKMCVMESLHLRNCSIRKLDKCGFGWSAKSVERGLRTGEVSPALLDDLGKFLNVDPKYLAGEYHRKAGKIENIQLREIYISNLRAEKYPYIIKQQSEIINDKFLYDRYFENILLIHDISMDQFNDLSVEVKEELQIEMEKAINPVLLKYFKVNAYGKELWPEIYRLQNQIEECE